MFVVFTILYNGCTCMFHSQTVGALGPYTLCLFHRFLLILARWDFPASLSPVQDEIYTDFHDPVTIILPIITDIEGFDKLINITFCGNNTSETSRLCMTAGRQLCRRRRHYVLRLAAPSLPQLALWSPPLA